MWTDVTTFLWTLRGRSDAVLRSREVSSVLRFTGVGFVCCLAGILSGLLFARLNSPGPPETVRILSDPKGTSSNSYTVKWKEPVSGGLPINYYELSTRNVYFYEGERVLGSWRKKNMDRAGDYTISHLLSNSHYQLEIIACNDIGCSSPNPEFIFTTDYGPPDPIKILSDPYGHSPYSYTVRWAEPISRGLPIIYYRMTARRVYGNGESPIEDWTIFNVDEEEHTLSDLRPDSHYQVELAACNKVGCSSPNSKFVFSTRSRPPVYHHHHSDRDSEVGFVMQVVGGIASVAGSLYWLGFI